jgi:hypothetical protein
VKESWTSACDSLNPGDFPLRINWRIIVSIVFVTSVLVFLFTLVQVRQEKERLTIDLQRRASLLGESLKEKIARGSLSPAEAIRIAAEVAETSTMVALAFVSAAPPPARPGHTVQASTLSIRQNMLSAHAIYRLLIDDEQPAQPPDDLRQLGLDFNPDEVSPDPKSEIRSSRVMPCKVGGGKCPS